VIICWFYVINKLQFEHTTDKIFCGDHLPFGDPGPHCPLPKVGVLEPPRMMVVACCKLWMKE